MTPVPPVIDGELAWGYWLRLEKTSHGPVYHDPAGSKWKSIRECFFRGRLRMDTTHPMRMGEMLERLLATLIAIGRGRQITDPAFSDMFGTHDGFVHHYVHWLQAERLVIADDARNRWTLTAEGAAAMRMIFATRPHAIGSIRPGSPSLAELVRLAAGPDPKESDRLEVEEKAAGWPSSFVRRRVGSRFGIVALRRDANHPDVQVASTVWSVLFPNEDDRDRLYDFLIERLDRWPDWTKLAYGTQGEALTLRLLTMALGQARPKALPAPRPEPD